MDFTCFIADLKNKNKISHLLNLSVEVFSTAVLIVDTEISKQILQIEQKLVKNPNWQEANIPVGYLQSVEKLNLGHLYTNPSSGR